MPGRTGNVITGAGSPHNVTSGGYRQAYDGKSDSRHVEAKVTLGAVQHAKRRPPMTNGR